MQAGKVVTFNSASSIFNIFVSTVQYVGPVLSVNFETNMEMLIIAVFTDVKNVTNMACIYRKNLSADVQIVDVGTTIISQILMVTLV